MKRLLVATLMLTACGDAIVPGSYRGEALYTIEGYVKLSVDPEELLGPADADPAELRVALMWSQAKGSSFNLDGASEQEVVTTGEFPARYEVTIYEPPEVAVLRPVSDGSGEMALGALVAYVDDDGDAHWDRDSEDLVGGAEERLFLYTPDGIDSPIFGQLAAGFHRLLPTTPCDDPSIQAGSLRFDMDPDSSTDLEVAGVFPAAAFVDVDCDPETVEWTGQCPPPNILGPLCQPGKARSPQDQAKCESCDDRLCPDELEGNGSACNAWVVDEALYMMSVCDADYEWRDCRGDQGPPPPYPHHGHCDLRRFCEDVFDACRYDDGADWGYCDQQFDDCRDTFH